jgi:hypothetical protein
MPEKILKDAFTGDEENPYEESDPRYHTRRVKAALQTLREHLREDIAKVDEPRAEALFETAAEVLGGLLKAFEHYEGREEEAWQK